MTIRAVHKSTVKDLSYVSQKRDIFRDMHIDKYGVYSIGCVALEFDPSECEASWKYLISRSNDFTSPITKSWMQISKISEDLKVFETYSSTYTWKHDISQHYRIMSRCEREIIENYLPDFLDLFGVNYIDFISGKNNAYKKITWG